MAKQQTNPFRFNQVVEKEYFCNRPENILVSDLIKSAQNVALIGPRRTGKTSLALEVCRKTKHKVIHCDLMRVGSYAEVIRRLVEAALRDSKAPKIEGFIKSLAHLRPTWTIDPISGGTQFTVTPSEKSTPENVIDTLRLIEKRCVSTDSILFIDEFQDITALPKHESFIAQMRSETQRWHDTAILFAGSDREKMKALFTESRSPFYQSATVLMINQLEEETFKRYIGKRFEQTGKSIEPECIKAVLEITEQHPNSAQKLLHFVWSKTPEGALANLETLESALSLTIRAEQDEFERTLDNLTLMQGRALKTIARLGGESTTSLEFLEAADIRNPTSSTKALMRCVQLKILLKDGSTYRFTNPFFKAWLQRLP
ncbi:AAA family ATPase [Coraliomargarita parva]|uniref:AAA family ATPase n=1 Tax=Coraliomargarita parva TaxID=3014050 RepID=UPI0022B52179|nr:AAA family ATPase [Coraliomargarita parva]